MRYTPVLTKQSALFNAWKLLCEIADTRNVPIRQTHAVLAQIVKAEETVEQGQRPAPKKLDKVKKLDSMNLLKAWSSV